MRKPWRSDLPSRGAVALILLAAAAALCGGCFATSPSRGGAQAKSATRGGPNPADVAVPDGYRIEPVATGLTFPTGVTFDDAGRVYVVEAGYSYGEAFATPRLLRVDAGGGTPTPVAAGGNNGPWTGAVFHNGAFYVAEGGVAQGGKILRITPDGQVAALIGNLPSMGDHHTNGPAVGPDGALYFAVGTATNSGVVGTDNAKYGWLKRAPQFHDIPARDIKLTGQNFTTDNPLTPATGDQAITGAYVPFGTPTQPGQVIKGQMPCNGAVFRIRPDGGGPTTAPARGGQRPELELVAWGLRNPYGLAFAPDGRLYVTENSYDVRGSRPLWGTGDLLWAIDPRREPLWHGFPDFFGGQPMADRPDWFRAPGGPEPKFLLAEHPNPPPRPAAWLGVHSSSNGLDVSRNPAFGFVGEAFIAQFGDMAPGVGKVMAPVGFKVVRVVTQGTPDRAGVVHDFAVNRGPKNGPATRLNRGGLERPIACRFDPAGTALYVVDFGVLTEDEQGNPHPRPGTGVLWRITRTGGGGV